MTNSATKPLFTPADANKVLPLVRSIVTDVVTEFARMRDAGRERRALEVETQSHPAGTAHPGGTAHAAGHQAPGGVATIQSATKTLIERLKSEVNERSVRIDGYLKELADLGAEVKDLERGLVDFPAERGGRPIYLCWELGETLVTHWRGVDEPYDKRRPVAEARQGGVSEIRLRTPEEHGPA
jgi:hypothetical protein